MDPLGTPTQQGPVDLNTASAEEFEALEGIGHVLAERIVAYRATTGLFASVDELARVPGIGQEQVENLRPYLTVSDPDEIEEEVLAPAFTPADAEDQAPSVMEMEESLLPAEDEDELDAELHAYEEMEIPEEELPPASVPEDEEPVAAQEPVAEDEPADAEEPVAEEEPAEVEEPVLETEAETPAPPVPPTSAEPDDAHADEEPEPAADEEPEAPDEESTDSEPAPATAPVPQPVREEPRSEPRAEARREPPERRDRDGFWRGVLLVLLGGLLGVLLTMLLLFVFPGMLSYAPQSFVDALSRNVATMQANQELTWERFNQLSAQTADLEQRMAEMEALAAQVADLQEQADQNAEQLGELDTRVETAEAELEAQGTQLAELDDAVEGVQERVTVFDAFFQGLRQLLQQMDPAPDQADDLES